MQIRLIIVKTTVFRNQRRFQPIVKTDVIWLLIRSVSNRSRAMPSKHSSRGWICFLLISYLMLQWLFQVSRSRKTKSFRSYKMASREAWRHNQQLCPPHGKTASEQVTRADHGGTWAHNTRFLLYWWLLNILTRYVVGKSVINGLWLRQFNNI